MVVSRFAVPLVVAWALAAASPAQTRLVVQGKPYFDGDVVLQVIDELAVGQTSFLGLGLDPLDPAITTFKGDYYIGTLLAAIPLPPMPAGGQLDIELLMPAEDPGLVGIPIVAQVLLGGQFSNAATIPLDVPYVLPAASVVTPSPAPSQKANFGHRIEHGDLNDDGNEDLVVSAWFEQVDGFDKAGRVYVLFGPDFLSSVQLSPSEPRAAGVFGQSIAVTDVTGDDVDDLVVTETAGSPALPGIPGAVYVFDGGRAFSSTHNHRIPSPGSGPAYTSWGSGVAVADFDQDGDVDIAVSNRGEDFAGLSGAGRIDLFHGPDFAVLETIGSPTPAESDGFGLRLVSADVNGDGLADLIESSCGVDVAGVSNVGAAHAFLSPALSTVVSIANPLPSGPQTCFGTWAFSGDLDEDGYDEAVFSDSRGRVFVFRGPSLTDHVVVEKPPTLQPNPFGEFAWGNDVDMADMNGDGAKDLLIGDPFGGELSGCAITAGGVVSIALAPYYETFYHLEDNSPSCDQFFGWSVRAVDVDGDRVPELVGGNDVADPQGVFNAGQVTVFY